ncbi:GtrA family protein [Arthrobacter echini]|uniref:GtrA family protein n=1 Tax=Arthrobacter echini TaxID=1529066 RepID=A0A4S5E922_9MICC|nr:GtrA family protein [Arthrobacter echini]THJ68023.1 GtrA family protein [Arthrobacter echini]
MDRIRGLASLLWREAAKFGAVGGIAFVIDNGLYWYLIHGPMSGSEVKARFVSAGVATVFAWVANRYWTFRHRRQPNAARELGMFVLINVIGMGIAAGCVAVAKYGFGVTEPQPLFLVGILGTVLATLVRFVAYRFWVFNVELDAEPGFGHDRELVHGRPSAQGPVPEGGTAARMPDEARAGRSTADQ